MGDMKEKDNYIHLIERESERECCKREEKRARERK